LPGTASQAAEKVISFAFPSGARNLSSLYAHEKNERFLAPLGMTKKVEPFFRSLFSRAIKYAAQIRL
jgi:hypothetical protein